ncbi:MAG TPA: RidA family protein [Candidatus Dormibacteraeota bacterium]|nr:RidA family protein [Candidatus Dormibacteraeota bacterium]
MTAKNSACSLLVCTLLACAPLLARPQTQMMSGKVQRIAIPNSDFPISQGVWVPAGCDTLYLSGSIPPMSNPDAPKGSTQAYGNTQTQTVAVLKRIDQTLAAQKLSLADVVMMHVYLVGDSTKDGKMDFAGFMAGYSQFFGTKEQPNKPARSAMQVAALAAAGALVEIEIIAVRPH